MSDETPKKRGPRPNNGGARKGAGRPKGSANVRTLEIANRVAKEGITPLEVMVDIMKTFYDAGQLPEALEAAAKAAPYLHSRLSSVDLKATVKKTTAELTRDELLAIAALAHTGGPGSPEKGRREGESDSVH